MVGWLAPHSIMKYGGISLLTLDYQYTTVQSDAAFSDFTRNWVSAGLTYRY